MNLPFDKGMIVRTAILVIAWANTFLASQGLSPLPFEESQVEFGVSLVVTFVISMWTWWKNNDVTHKARRITKYTKDKGLK